MYVNVERQNVTQAYGRSTKQPRALNMCQYIESDAKKEEQLIRWLIVAKAMEMYKCAANTRNTVDTRMTL